MEVVEQTMPVRIVEKIRFAFVWFFKLMVAYAWPVVQWITSANMLIDTKKDETEDEKALAEAFDGFDEPDGMIKFVNYGTDLILADYIHASSDENQVPYVMKRCVDEIEVRGLHQVGLYRISGSDREIKEVKKKFMKHELNLDLSDLDIHVVCGTLKDFLRSLKDPLIPNAMWKSVTETALNSDSEDFYKVVSRLPKTNLRCLIFFITHLQKVMEIPENKIDKECLAKILGPTVVGYSSADPSPLELVGQTHVLAKCMERLLELEWWMVSFNVMDCQAIL
eukprot:GFUD01120351.1.p1 GENE.GFUD01120351.1~~GFUD01120351.1.p1  ORF type:complete len:280 (-),score=61.31 GFUD01120351.1:125-964(-)